MTTTPACPEFADCDPRDKDPDTNAVERRARQFLARLSPDTARADGGLLANQQGFDAGAKTVRFENMTLARCEAAAPVPEPVGVADAWRCFHCDKTFTDPECAAEHFGRFEDCQPACKIGVEQFRKMEAELANWRVGNDTATREFYRLGADHYRKERRAEEEGYEKGLRDGQALAASPEPPVQSGEGWETGWRTMDSAPKDRKIVGWCKFPAGEEWREVSWRRDFSPAGGNWSAYGLSQNVLYWCEPPPLPATPAPATDPAGEETPEGRAVRDADEIFEQHRPAIAAAVDRALAARPASQPDAGEPYRGPIKLMEPKTWISPSQSAPAAEPDVEWLASIARDAFNRSPIFRATWPDVVRAILAAQKEAGQ